MGGLFGGGKSTTIDNGSVANFQINQATYGIVVPVILGTSRQSGNVIDYYNFTKIAHSETQRTGKGGGGSRTTTVTYTYKAAVLIALCEGQIEGIGKVWIDTDTITTLAGTGFTLFDGAIGQGIWSYTESVNPSHALPYSGLAYVAGYIDLNSSGAMQTYNFEIKGVLRFSGDGLDINPYNAVEYILTNNNNGLGFALDNIYTASAVNFANFCKASDLFITVPLTDQSKSYETINKLCELANTIVFWSQSKIKFVPRCESVITGNGTTYTPNTIPEYDLDADDFIENDDGKLVEWERTDNAETYNQVTVEFTNRDNGYETETVDYQILADINERGLRPMSTVSYPWIHTKARAEYVAQQIAMDSCYSRNTYKFTLGLSHSLLEPGDIVTLTDTATGLNKLPVIIENVTENGDEYYDCEAKYRPYGTYSPARYNIYESERASIDRQVSPGNINQPVIFEPPANLENSMAIYVAGSGGEEWGGCNVWVSDDGDAYKQIGTIDGPSRQGVLATALPAGIDPDVINTLGIDLSLSRSSLFSGTRADADNYNTLCYVGGELISYETATLTATNKYDLTYLRRGIYGTENKAHGAGEQFLRVDKQTIFSYPITEDQIGKTIYLKFTSWNTFGVAEQDLDEVQVYNYVIKGTALTSPLSNVTDLRNYYENGNMYLLWSPITDFRSPVEYEIRKGTSWGSAEILGRTFNTKFQLQGNGTYWVAAAYKNVYSYVPTEIIVTGARYVQNVIAVFDEKETGWTGTVSGNAVLMDDEIRLIGSGEFDSIPDFDAVWDLNYYGFDAGQGIYQIPESHKIDIGAPALCNVSVNYLFYGDTIYPSFDDVPDVDAITNWDGDYSSYVSCKVQINIDNAGWQYFSVGQYYGQIFDFRVILENYSKDVTAILSGFSFAVDVPDITESKNVTVLADGTSIIYDAHFHAVPEPQITIFNPQAGDEAYLSYQGLTGFTIQIKNAGIGVERNINYMVQKY